MQRGAHGQSSPVRPARPARLIVASLVLGLAACGSAGPPIDRERRQPQTPGAPAAGAGAPGEFIAANGGRLGVYDATSGALLRYLTREIPGGSHSPRLVERGARLLFVLGGGESSASIASMDPAGGPWQQEVGPDGGSAIEAAMSHVGLVYVSAQHRAGRDSYSLRVRQDVGHRVLTTVTEPDVMWGVAAAARWISYLVGPEARPQLRIADATGELAEIVVVPEQGCTWQAATWRERPDEPPTLLTAQRCDGTASGDTLVEYDADGLRVSEPRHIGVSGVVVMDLDVTGSHLILHSQNGPGTNDIWRLDHEETVPVRVARGLYEPTW